MQGGGTLSVVRGGVGWGVGWGVEWGGVGWGGVEWGMGGQGGPLPQGVSPHLSVGNSSALAETYLVEAFNLKAAIAYMQGERAAASQV